MGIKDKVTDYEDLKTGTLLVFIFFLLNFKKMKRETVTFTQSLLPIILFSPSFFPFVKTGKVIAQFNM